MKNLGWSYLKSSWAWSKFFSQCHDRHGTNYHNREHNRHMKSLSFGRFRIAKIPQQEQSYKMKDIHDAEYSHLVHDTIQKGKRMRRNYFCLNGNYLDIHDLKYAMISFFFHRRLESSESFENFDPEIAGSNFSRICRKNTIGSNIHKHIRSFIFRTWDPR